MNDSIAVKDNKSSKRRSLQSLQPISSDNKVLTRSMATNKRPNNVKDKNHNQRITKWLTQKDSIESDVKYWKTLAKERQKALEMTLKGNEDLSGDNERLTKELEEVNHQKELLVQENQHLSQLAEEGMKLRDLLQEYID